MKKVLIIFIILISGLIAQACQFTVLLSDSYGDGWNGNTITISVNGSVVLNAITLTSTGSTSGDGPEAFTFNANDGDNVVITFGATGSYTYECEYIINNPIGVTIFTDGANAVTPTGGSFTANCPVPTCTDGIMNGDETGIDCGGTNCSACPPPTCTDGIMNGNETSIDCGGTDCPACPTIWNINNVTGQTITTCSGTLYDSGGPNGNYGYSENYSVTFCSGTSDVMVLNINYEVENSYEKLYIYDGPNTASALIATLTGGPSSATYFTTGTCVTIKFTSDGSVNKPGFSIDLSCGLNDEPCDAWNIIAGESCTNISGSNANVGSSSVPAPPCANYNGQDVWYKTVVTSTGMVTATTTAGTLTDAGMAFYSGSDCNNLTFLACDDNSSPNSNMPQIVQSGLTPGTTIWIRIWDKDGNQTGTFYLCVKNNDNCISSPSASDFCDSATPICSFDGYCGNTSDAYTSSQVPSGFCGSVENNSWISFVASETSATLDVWTSNCESGDGIQMEIYSTSNCATFTSVSNCISDGMMSDFQISTNVALTIGQTYYLMVDGWGGDVCDYIIAANSGVMVAEAISVETGSNTVSLCNGELTQLQASGGSSYTWSPAIGLSNPNIANPIATPSVTTQYTVTVTGGSCGGTDTASVWVYVSTSMSIETSSTPIDCGLCNGTATVSNINGGISPYSYNWSNSETTQTVNNLCSGDIIVTVSDNVGCEVIDTINIPNTQNIVASYTPLLAQCFLNNSFNFTNTGSSGTDITYSWSFESANTLTSTDENPANISWNQIGTFAVTQTVSYFACSETFTDSVTILPNPTSDFTTTFIPCNGDSSVIEYIGNAPTTSNYNWDFNGGSILTGSGQGSYNVIWSAGTYNVSLYVEQNGCYSDTTTIQVISPEALSKPNVALTHNLCFGDSLGQGILSINGGTAPFSYIWTPLGFTENGNTYSDLPADGYDVTVTDVNGCQAFTNFTITQPLQLNSYASLVNNAHCGQSDGCAKIDSVSGGVSPYTYLWNAGNSLTSVNNCGLPEGFAIVTVTDANGCSDTSLVNVGNLTGVTCDITSSVDVLCFGGNNGSATVEMTANGIAPYTYTWANGAGTVIQINTNNLTSNPISSLTAGLYTVTLTDVVNCSASASIVINQPTKLIADIIDSAHVSCYGGNDGYASVSANATGTSPYTYLWNNIDINSLALNLAKGTYTVTITDANNCKAITSVIINQPNILNAFISYSTNATCNGLSNGTAQVSQTGGTSPYTYSWMSGGSSAINTNLSAGKENVVVIDNHGCTDTTSVVIGQPNPIGITFQNTTMPKCFGDNNGSVIPIVNGGTPSYSYVYWSNVDSVGISGNNLSAGTNKLIVTDISGCTGDTTFNLSEPTKLVPIITDKTPPPCYGICDGKARVIFYSGIGTPPYTYSWSSGAVADSATNVCGVFKVIVSDSNGCSAIVIDSLTYPKALKINANPTNASICKGQNLPINASCILGCSNTPISYYWNSVLGSNTINVASLKDTAIYLNAKDVNGCSSNTVVVKIKVFPDIEASIDASDYSICPSDSIIINASVKGGNGGPYICRINDLNVAVPPITIFPEGVDTTIRYIFTVSDFCGSPVGKDSVDIAIMPAAPNNFTSDTTFGCQPLIVNFLESSPNEGQTYYWQFGDNQNNNFSTLKNPTHTFNSDGIFDVTLSITSSNGCINKVTQEEMIEIFKNPNANFLPDPISQSIINPVIYFQNNSSNKFSCFWDFDDGEESSLESPEHEYELAGIYNVELIIIDENGCTDTAYNEVIIKEEYLFYAPTAFSPDNDGINEEFYIKNHGINPDSYNMLIYNRWGELIFETRKLDKAGAWDGKVKNGAVAPAGVYVWYSIYRDFQNVEHQKSGNVTLIR